LAVFVNGDGKADVITGEGATTPLVNVFDGATLRGGVAMETANFVAFQGFGGGVRVGAVDRKGDGRADVIAAPITNVPQVKIFDVLTVKELDGFFALGGTAGVALFVGGS
jgi:hypothetical protein